MKALSYSFVALPLLVLYVMRLSDAAGTYTESHEVTVQLVSERHSSRYRVRRNVEITVMPKLLIFTVDFRDSPLLLTLRKSNLLTVETGDVQTTLQANVMPEDSAVYTDPRYKSTFIINRLDGTYNLTGTLIVSGDSWSLEPVPVATPSPMSQLHRMIRSTRREHILNSGSDAYTDIPEKSELVNTSKYLPLSKHLTGRFKRAVTRHIVDIVFVVDYVDYRKWVTLYGETNALSKLRLWYTYVADSMRAIYESITDPDISITTTTKLLKVLTKEGDDIFIANATNNGKLDHEKGLKAFASWLKQQADISTTPHYMLFTGRQFSSAGTVGAANVGTVCSSKSVSIVENIFSGLVAQIAAHELGHSLNAFHDADTGGNCSDADMFVMDTNSNSPVDLAHQGNPWRFSKCSIEKIKSFISSKSCTLEKNVILQNALPAPTEGQRAGETIGRDEQCRLAMNFSGSEYSQAMQQQNGGESSICGGMLCKSRNATVYVFVIPLEYTSCGVDMSCVRGYCVPRINSTTAATSIISTASSTTARSANTTNATAASPITKSTTANITTATHTPTKLLTASFTTKTPKTTKLSTANTTTATSKTKKISSASTTTATPKPTKLSTASITTAKPTKLSIASITTAKPTKLSNASSTTAKPTKLSTASITTAKPKPTKLSTASITTAKPTKLSNASSTTAKPTKLSTASITTAKPKPTKLSTASITTVKPTKLSTASITKAKPTKLSTASITTAKQTKISKASIIIAGPTSTKLSPASITTATPNKSSSTASTTSTTTTSSAKQKTQGDCIMNNSNGSVTSFIDCLLNIWRLQTGQ